ncbi:MAG: NAD(P)-dependent oxidoreductase [Inquilinus sp.]|nr:NAD(P)-dependent oxidoreductase [Inquilinus sp.]
MADEPLPRVGIVGLGRMGLPMARRLAAAGVTIAGCDTDSAAVAAARAAGIGIAATPADLARSSDLVLILVGSESQVAAALLADDGVLAGDHPGSIVAICSTVAPSFVTGLADRCAGRGVDLLDAPLARGEQAARDGSLLVYAGGDAAVLARCRPALDVLAEHVFLLGGLGAGQAAKAVNNMLLWACMTASVEGLELGEALGVDREALRAALGFGSGANWALTTRADERPAFWAEKDLAIVRAEAAAAGLTLPVCEAVDSAIRAFKRARGLPSPPLDC